SFHRALVIFRIVNQLTDQRAHKRPDDETKRNRREYPHDKSDVRTPNPVLASPKPTRPFSRDHIIENGHGNRYDTRHGDNPVVVRNRIGEVKHRQSDPAQWRPRNHRKETAENPRNSAAKSEGKKQ